MKAILASMCPEHAMSVLNKQKAIDIRKTAPKCDLPIEVYVYCVKSAPYLHLWSESAAIEPGGPKGTNKVTWQWSWRLDKKKWYMARNGKVVAKFTLLSVDKLDMENPYEGQTRKFLDEACVMIGEARTYAGGVHPYYNPLYAWHISDLVVFDKPKRLSELGIKRAPQSWQYVEIEE